MDMDWFWEPMPDSISEDDIREAELYGEHLVKDQVVISPLIKVMYKKNEL